MSPGLLLPRWPWMSVRLMPQGANEAGKFSGAPGSSMRSLLWSHQGATAPRSKQSEHFLSAFEFEHVISTAWTPKSMGKVKNINWWFTSVCLTWITLSLPLSRQLKVGLKAAAIEGQDRSLATAQRRPVRPILPAYYSTGDKCHTKPGCILLSK